MTTNDTSTKRFILDYTSRDYKGIRSTLVGLAKGIMPDWQTVGEAGDFGTMLLELYAYAGDVMNYYIDRVGSEAFLGTAARRQSISYIADMFGYVPMGQRAATVPVTFYWQWDTDSLPEGVVPTYTYTITSADALSGIVTLELSSESFTILISPGQTITVSGLGVPFDGQFVVESITPATLSLPFSLTYRVPSASPATGTTSGSTTVVTGNVVVIPTKTRLATESNDDGIAVSFETDYQVLLDSAAGKQVAVDSTVYSVSVQASASEGVTIAPYLLGTSNGVPNSEFMIANPGVIDRTVRVYTKEGGQVVPWAEVDKMSLATPTQSVFTTYVDDEGYTHVLFGDNASGRIPPINAQIFVEYRYGSGLIANGLGVNTVTILDNDYATSLGVTVSNTASPVGGADIESVESMRYSIPRSNALKQRAVTLDDYVSLALQVPGITKATAYGANYTSVYVRIASGPASQAYLTTSVIGKQVASNVVTIALGADAALTTGQIVYLTGVDVAYDGTQQVTGVYPSTSAVQISNKVLTSNVATLTTETTHGFRVGQTVTVSGVDSTFNGNHVLTAVTATTFSYAKTHANVATAAVTADTAVVVGAPGFTFSFTTANNLEMDPPTSGSADITTTDPAMAILINGLEAYLEDKKLIGSVVYGEPVEWTDADIDISVKVRPLYNRESVRSAVQAAVVTVFAYDNVDFGRRVSIGDVYRAALVIDGVDYITINELMVTGGTPGTVEDVNSEEADEANLYKIPRINPNLAEPWVVATGGLANT